MNSLGENIYCPANATEPRAKEQNESQREREKATGGLTAAGILLTYLPNFISFHFVLFILLLRLLSIQCTKAKRASQKNKTATPASFVQTLAKLTKLSSSPSARHPASSSCFGGGKFSLVARSSSSSNS